MKHYRALAVVAGVGFLSVALLWSAGLFLVPPPGFTGGLLAAALLSGSTVLVRRRALHHVAPKVRGAADLARLGTLVAAALFLVGLFTVTSRSLPVEPGTRHREGRAERLRIVSWNVLHGYPRFPHQEERFEGQLQALRALDPTVLVLQEAWSTTRHGSLTERLGEALGMGYVYARANGSRRLIGFEEGSAVLSRVPILRAERVLLRPRKVPWRARIALFVTLQVGPGEELSVVGTHLTNLDTEVAAAQARDLAARLPDGGFSIVAGDLNAGSRSEAARAFLGRGLLDIVPGGIDHVFVGPDSTSWQVVRAQWTLTPRDLVHLVGKSATLSDHPAILVDLVRP